MPRTPHPHKNVSTDPLVIRLGDDWRPSNVFERWSSLPRCLWLDSADEPGPISPPAPRRYSYVAAAPIAWLDGDQNSSPWATLARWSESLPSKNHSDLPPFQGGLGGLIGYEAGSLLEKTGVSRINDLPTPPMGIGLYDVVFCFDHRSEEALLLSQGYVPDEGSAGRDVWRRSPDRAKQRADQFIRWFETPPPASNHARADEVNDNKSSAVQSNFSDEEFKRAVGEIIDRICRGDSFQVNLAQRLTMPATCGSSQLYTALRKHNPAPYAGFLDGGDYQVLSSSPEGFLRVDCGTVESRPIKGTVPRTGDESSDRDLAKRLLSSKKDRAENVMIVDLVRNDLSRVCEDDSVLVKQLCELESYEYVQHLVSVVQGRLREDASLVDLIRVCFPGGSVTGAPKIEAMRTIAELEPHCRGAYCGSLGFISSQVDAEFNILIRTITATRGTWQFPVGGGITARSLPAAELEETWTKAQGMLEAIRAATREGVAR